MENIVKVETKNSRNKRKIIVDKIVHLLLFFLVAICASIIIVSVIFILIKGIQPFVDNYGADGEFVNQSLSSFFTNSTWTYDGNGGAMFLVLTTIYVVALSLIISVPTSIFTALFIAKISPRGIKDVIRTAIDLLAAIPSVIFGLFGKGIINPFVYNIAEALGIQTFAGSSILSGALIIAVMSIPTMTTLSISAINAVDQSLINGSLALGASTAQTNMKIIIRSAKSGIFAGIILGIGRALGEATAIQMVIGNSANGLNFYNIFSPGSTIASAMLSGINEASGFGYDIRFSLGIVLMAVIVVTNLILNAIKNYNRDKDGPVRKIIKKIGGLIKNGKEKQEN